ncbi:MAG: hypothetical protein S4CHLAM102_13310 [Chlamydiia bacterium]|nr:hypothetical protein [Chlamydiia bacterium]
MKIEELKNKSKQELGEIIYDAKKELYKLQTEKCLTRTVKKPHEFKANRKLIARAKTVMKQQEKN